MPVQGQIQPLHQLPLHELLGTFPKWGSHSPSSTRCSKLFFTKRFHALFFDASIVSLQKLEMLCTPDEARMIPRSQK